MKRKIHIKKKHKKIKIIIILLIIIVNSYLIIEYINKTISPKLINYAELEIKKLSSSIITESLKTEDIENLNTNKIFIITKNEKNEIMTIDINSVTLNQIIKNTTTEIQKKLKELEQGKINENNEENKKGIVLKIPLGQIYDNFLLNDKGPKIPVKIKVLGDMESKINSSIKNYGINNALLEITLEITIEEKVILPISTKEIQVKQEIPIVIKIITGTVPNYYSNGINKSESFSIPIE